MKKIKRNLLDKTASLLQMYHVNAEVPFGCNLLEGLFENLKWKEKKSTKQDITKYGKGLKTYVVKI